MIGMFQSELTSAEFNRISNLVMNVAGIKLPPSKKHMLEGRLRKRLRKLNIDNFKEYCAFLFSAEGQKKELIHMIDVVTTNKTDFFREPEHFQYLFNKSLPTIISEIGAGIQKNFMVWSAGCSTGEEPYTIAMVLEEFRRKHPGLGFNFQIIASDISTNVLSIAKMAVYSQEKVTPVATELLHKYFMRSKNKGTNLVKVAPEIRNTVKFRRINFLENDFGMRENMDIIFCRNVIIYFNRHTQEKIINRLASHLNPHGYLFLGHSENITGLNVPLKQVAPTIYRKIR